MWSEAEKVVNIHKKQKLEMEITAAMLLLLFLVVHVQTAVCETRTTCKGKFLAH